MSRIVQLNEDGLCPRDRRARGVDEPVFEVELSSQDLLDLTQCSAHAQAGANDGRAQVLEADDALTTSRTAGQPTSSPSQSQRGPVSLALGTGAVAAVAVTAIALLDVTPTTEPSATLVAVSPPIVTPGAEPAVSGHEALPVKFSNPFDPAEVFEFPVGTSLTEARSRVVEILTKRAQERQEDYPRVATTHRPRVAAR